MLTGRISVTAPESPNQELVVLGFGLFFWAKAGKLMKSERKEEVIGKQHVLGRIRLEIVSGPKN